MINNKKQRTIDPRILIIFSILYTIYIFIEQSPVNLALLTIVFLIILLLRHIGLIKQLIILFTFTGLMIFVILFAIFRLNPIVLSVIFLRITSITTLYMLFYAEINPENLTKALIYFKVPYKQAWTISTSYRYIFFLVRESQEVKNALLLRGVPLDGNIFEKLKSLPIIVSQLVFRTNFLSIKFGETLFAKSWSPYGKKTWYLDLKFFDSIKMNVLILILSLIVLILPILNFLGIL